MFLGFGYPALAKICVFIHQAFQTNLSRRQWERGACVAQGEQQSFLNKQKAKCYECHWIIRAFFVTDETKQSTPQIRRNVY